MVCGGGLFGGDCGERFRDVCWRGGDMFNFGEVFYICGGEYFLVVKFYVFVYGRFNVGVVL